MAVQKLPHSILVIEDSDEDFEAIRRIMVKNTLLPEIYRCIDGDQALDLLYRRGAYAKDHAQKPSMILLDLNLPGTDGREVLSLLKQDERVKSIPVVIFTTSSNPKDIEACYDQGASSYIVKPVNTARFTRIVELLIEYWFKVVTLASD